MNYWLHWSNLVFGENVVRQHSSSQVHGSCHGAHSLCCPMKWIHYNCKRSFAMIFFFLCWDFPLCSRQMQTPNTLMLLFRTCLGPQPPSSVTEQLLRPQWGSCPFLCWFPDQPVSAASLGERRVVMLREETAQAWASDGWAESSGWGYFPFCGSVVAGKLLWAPGCSHEQNLQLVRIAAAWKMVSR